MRRVGDEAPEPALRRGALRERVLDLAEHGVQGQAKPADLGLRGGRLDTLAVVASRDLTGGGAHPAQRPKAKVDKKPRQDRGRSDDGKADEDLELEELTQGG